MQNTQASFSFIPKKDDFLEKTLLKNVENFDDNVGRVIRGYTKLLNRPPEVIPKITVKKIKIIEKLLKKEEEKLNVFQKKIHKLGDIRARGKDKIRVTDLKRSSIATRKKISGFKANLKTLNKVRIKPKNESLIDELRLGLLRYDFDSLGNHIIDIEKADRKITKLENTTSRRGKIKLHDLKIQRMLSNDLIKLRENYNDLKGILSSDIGEELINNLYSSDVTMDHWKAIHISDIISKPDIPDINLKPTKEKTPFFTRIMDYAKPIIIPAISLLPGNLAIDNDTRILNQIDPENYFNILGVSINATKNEIRKAYRSQIFQYHPDKTGNLPSKLKESSKEITIKLNKAKDALLDPSGGPKYKKDRKNLVVSYRKFKKDVIDPAKVEFEQLSKESNPVRDLAIYTVKERAVKLGIPLELINEEFKTILKKDKIKAAGKKTIINNNIPTEITKKFTQEAGKDTEGLAKTIVYRYRNIKNPKIKMAKMGKQLRKRRTRLIKKVTDENPSLDNLKIIRSMEKYYDDFLKDDIIREINNYSKLESFKTHVKDDFRWWLKGHTRDSSTKHKVEAVLIDLLLLGTAGTGLYLGLRSDNENNIKITGDGNKTDENKTNEENITIIDYRGINGTIFENNWTIYRESQPREWNISENIDDFQNISFIEDLNDMGLDHDLFEAYRDGIIKLNNEAVNALGIKDGEVYKTNLTINVTYKNNHTNETSVPVEILGPRSPQLGNSALDVYVKNREKVGVLHGKVSAKDNIKSIEVLQDGNIIAGKYFGDEIVQEYDLENLGEIELDKTKIAGQEEIDVEIEDKRGYETTESVEFNNPDIETNPEINIDSSVPGKVILNYRLDLGPDKSPYNYKAVAKSSGDLVTEKEIEKNLVQEGEDWILEGSTEFDMKDFNKEESYTFSILEGNKELKNSQFELSKIKPKITMNSGNVYFEFDNDNYTKKVIVGNDKTPVEVRGPYKFGQIDVELTNISTKDEPYKIVTQKVNEINQEFDSDNNEWVAYLNLVNEIPITLPPEEANIRITAEDIYNDTGQNRISSNIPNAPAKIMIENKTATVEGKNETIEFSGKLYNPDGGDGTPRFNVSYKNQTISTGDLTIIDSTGNGWYEFKEVIDISGRIPDPNDPHKFTIIYGNSTTKMDFTPDNYEEESSVVENKYTPTTDILNLKWTREYVDSLPLKAKVGIVDGQGNTILIPKNASIMGSGKEKEIEIDLDMQGIDTNDRNIYLEVEDECGHIYRNIQELNKTVFNREFNISSKFPAGQQNIPLFGDYDDTTDTAELTLEDNETLYSQIDINWNNLDQNIKNNLHPEDHSTTLEKLRNASEVIEDYSQGSTQEKDYELFKVWQKWSKDGIISGIVTLIHSSIDNNNYRIPMVETSEGKYLGYSNIVGNMQLFKGLGVKTIFDSEYNADDNKVKDALLSRIGEIEENDGQGYDGAKDVFEFGNGARSHILQKLNNTIGNESKIGNYVGTVSSFYKIKQDDNYDHLGKLKVNVDNKFNVYSESGRYKSATRGEAIGDMIRADIREVAEAY